KRGWPGVPNRYSTRSVPSEMRPKSIATVVDVLPVAFDRSSIPSLCEVIAASVVSGEISEIEPTKVVFPTPKPPATTILTGIGASADVVGWAGASECLKAIEHPFQESEVGTVPDVAGT